MSVSPCPLTKYEQEVNKRAGLADRLQLPPDINLFIADKTWRHCAQINLHNTQKRTNVNFDTRATLVMVSSPASDREMIVSGSSEDGDVLDLADDEGWEDLEPDVETVKVVCLMCDGIFDGAQSMLEHCKDNHQMDIVSIRKDLGEHA